MSYPRSHRPPLIRMVGELEAAAARRVCRFINVGTCGERIALEMANNINSENSQGPTPRDEGGSMEAVDARISGFEFRR